MCLTDEENSLYIVFVDTFFVTLQWLITTTKWVKLTLIQWVPSTQYTVQLTSSKAMW